MNLKEAYSILDLPEGADESTAKKKYRELTKKYHPDVNKEPGAEDRFKKINEAYQIVSTGEDTERKQQPQYRGSPFGGNPFHGSPFSSVENVDNIDLTTAISFKESVLGAKREIKYNRNVKCGICMGRGMVPQNNGCDKCGGHGVIRGQQGNMIFTRTCDKCGGRVQALHCTECKSKGMITVETSVTVSIPGGIENEAILRLGGMGHFAGSFMNMDQHTNVHLKVYVATIDGLKLQGSNVVSKTNITLLEALTGCSKTVNTVLGDKTINIHAGMKNKDEVIIPNLGVNGTGNHVVTVNIEYPKDTSLLIEALKKEIS
jgi:molecular chaperone DnaJ